MKFISIFILILLVFLNVNFTGATESSGFNFLKTHVGARPSALGGAFAAVQGDIYSIYYNPAGLSAIQNRTVSATYLKHLIDFQSGFLGYAHYMKDVGTIAGAINYIDYGTFDETNIDAEKLGTFSANTFILSGSYSKEVYKNISAGINAKFIRSVISSYSSSAIAADFGLLYDVPFIDGLDVGVAILNFGKSTSAFIDSVETLPQKIVAGFSKKLAHLPLLFNANIYKYNDEDFQFAIGGEFTLDDKGGFFLRFGYNSLGRDQRVGGNLDRIAGASVGFGFNRNQYQLDYSFSSLGEVGSQNRVSFYTNF